MFGYKVVVSAVALATLISSSAFAADGALTAGKPAGVKQAQVESSVLVLGAVGAAVVLGVALAVSNSGDHDNNGATGPFSTAATGTQFVSK